MKKIGFLIIIILIALLAISCSEDPIDPVTTDPLPEHDYESGIVLGSFTKDLEIPVNSDALHLISSSTLKSASFEKGAGSEYFVGLEDENGILDTVVVEDGEFRISGIENLYPLTNSFVLAVGNISVTYKVPEYELTTFVDTLPMDEPNDYYPSNLIETYQDDLGDMYNVFLDTIEVYVGMVDYSDSYNNLLFHVNGQLNFVDLGDDIVMNYMSMNSVNDPFSVDVVHKTFYFMDASHNIKKVRLIGNGGGNEGNGNGNLIEKEIVWDAATQGEALSFRVMTNYFVVKIGDVGYAFFNESGFYEELSLSQVPYDETVNEVVLNGDIYVGTDGTHNSFSVEISDGEFVVTDLGNLYDNHNGLDLSSFGIYIFDFDNKSWIFSSVNGKYVSEFNKLTKEFNEIYISEFEGLNDETNHHGLKFEDDCFLYKKGKIVKVENNGDVSLISNEYEIFNMYKGEHIGFYGKSNSKLVRGIINELDEIEILEEVNSEENQAAEIEE